MTQPSKTPPEAIAGTALPTSSPLIWLKEGRPLMPSNGIVLCAEDWPPIEAALNAAGYEVRSIAVDPPRRRWWPR